MIDIERIMEIKEVKKEADRLMIAKVTKYENEIAELKKRVQEAEGEVTIIRGIGMNSPEFRALKKELKEVKDDNKKLAKQIEDMRIDQGGWR